MGSLGCIVAVLSLHSLQEKCNNFELENFSSESFLSCSFKEDYKKLEVFAFEMETTIASLEEELTAACKDKEEVVFRNETLAAELEALSDELNTSNSELKMLQEEVLNLVRFSMIFSISWIQIKFTVFG